jgi:membrane protease YdiL (CAAX protease family)
MTEAVSRGTAGGLRALARRHPLTVFVAIVLALGWATMTPMVLAARGLISLGGLPPEIFVLFVNLGVMLPAAIWVTSVVDGRAGVAALMRRAVRWQFGPAWWVIVLLAFPLLTIGAARLLGASFAQGALWSVALKGIGSLLVAVAVIHLWEETVWGGFLQTRLERRHNFFLAAALTALPFAGVHIPLLLMGSDRSILTFLAGLGSLVGLAVVARTLWGVVLRGAANSTLAIGLMHGVFNASNNRGQLVDSLLTNADVNRAASLIVLPLLTLALLIFNRQKVTRSYRLRLEGGESRVSPELEPIARS